MALGISRRPLGLLLLGALLPCLLPVAITFAGGSNAVVAEARGVDLISRALGRHDGTGDYTEYDAVIANTGDQPGINISVLLEGFECQHPRGDSGLAYREAQRVPLIAPSSTVTVTWQTPLRCTWARVTADNEREVSDGDRTDNTLEVWFRRQPQTYEIGPLGLTRGGDPNAWRMPLGGSVANGGFFGEFWFTSGSVSRTQATVYGVWTVSVPPGLYRLSAYIPRHGDLNGQRKPDAPAAIYQVWDQTSRWRDAVTIDQERFAEMWVPLGTFALNWNSRVRLGDNVGASSPGGTWVLFDTIRVVSEISP